jgi:UPF0271 protein
MNLSAEEATFYVQYQVAALQGMCGAAGVPLRHVKPHGALYNMAAKDYKLALAIAEGIAELDPHLIILAQGAGAFAEAAKTVGLPFACEVFADRAYEDDGTLVSRTKPGAMIENEEEAAARVVKMVCDGTVETISGKTIPVRADSICVHGDGAQALAFVQKIRAALAQNEVELRALAAM